MRGIGTEIRDMQILSEDNRADILGHQNAPVDIGFDDASSAKSFKMLDLQEVGARITAEQIVVERRRQCQSVGPAITLAVENIDCGDHVIQNLIDAAPIPSLYRVSAVGVH